MQNNKLLLNLLATQNNSMNAERQVYEIDYSLPDTDEIIKLRNELKAKASDRSFQKTNGPKLGALVKKNVKRMQGAVSISNYIPEFIVEQHTDKNILKKQLTSLDQFINDQKVYKAVERAYNEREYKQFSPESGDSNCQSRVFLLEIMSQSKSYGELTPEERLLLTICFIMNKYKTTDYDPFMMEKREQEYNQSIQIDGISLGKFATHDSRIYDGAALISHALAEISTRYMQEADKRYNNSRLLDDLGTYTRKRGNGNDYAKQQLQLPTMLTMYTCLANMHSPIVYKVIQVKQQDDEYSFGGADLIVKTPTEGGFRLATKEEMSELNAQAAYIIEMVSMINDETKQCTHPMLTPLAKAENFEQFMQALSTDGYAEKLSLLTLTNMDAIKGFKDAKKARYETEIARKYYDECVAFDQNAMQLLCNNYAKDTDTRGDAGCLASTYHCYPSTIANELAKFAMIDRSLKLDRYFANDPCTLSL